MKNKNKIIILLVSFILFSGCAQNPPLEQEQNVDFNCLNMCMDSTKGMKLSQLKIFCKSQCMLGE
tara:strand:+ start:1491 stop:1685 length:195 start_codon:yes stop_codon:yes gene_type:complete